MMYLKIKRLLDLVISIILFIALLPIFILISISIKLDSKGKIIFKHKRFGQNLEPIYVYKFRTMVENADKLGPQYTIKNDIRVTKLGKILRKTSIDELPQLLNILKGEMSLIGPRPDAYEDVASAHQKIRCRVMPGLTGLAQVSGRSSLSTNEKEYYDEEYVKNISFKLDCIIFFKTIKVVISSKNIA
ncbi:MAG: sugar transferase [Bacilli bacterium]